jgi:tRNA(His) 5'-end guanylyltransferase
MAKDYLLSRTKSGFKNSVSQLAQCHFSAKQLNGVGSARKIEMLLESGINYHSMPSTFKYGAIWYKEPTSVWSQVAGLNIIRNQWRSVPLGAVADSFAISRLEETISRLSSQGSAGPKPAPPDP